MGGDVGEPANLIEGGERPLSGRKTLPPSTLDLVLVSTPALDQAEVLGSLLYNHDFTSPLLKLLLWSRQVHWDTCSARDACPLTLLLNVSFSNFLDSPDGKSLSLAATDLTPQPMATL